MDQRIKFSGAVKHLDHKSFSEPWRPGKTIDYTHRPEEARHKGAIHTGGKSKIFHLISRQVFKT